MKLHSFISRLQKLNAYLEDFPLDIDEKETESLPVYDIMDIIYHFMPATSKIKIIEQGFIDADFTVKQITDFF